MPKKKDRNRAGPRVIPAHWQAPEALTPLAPTGDTPAEWPLGPCWATRIDHAGSQGVFLSRQRPWTGSLTVVGAVVNDLNGMVDGMGDHAIGRARLEERLIEVGRPSRQIYTVPPEYVVFRMRQAEAQAEGSAQRLPAAYRASRALLAGIDPDWSPDLAAVEAEHSRPDLLEQTPVLVHAAEFNDWRAAPDDDLAVEAFLAAVDDALKDQAQLVPGYGATDEEPKDLDLLSETQTITEPWPLTGGATRAVEALFEEHVESVIPRDASVRHRERLRHMAYLTGLAGQAVYSSLIATAAWSLAPERETPLASNPFLRALMRRTVARHVTGADQDEHAGHDHEGHIHH